MFRISGGGRLALAAVLLSAPAAAQMPPAELGARYVPAPWWMREPVIASIGVVRTELPANRAMFSAQFSAVERTAAEATDRAAARVRELDASLRRIGAERLRLETSFSTRPLYEQYRERDGSLVDNQRADKIDRYEVIADLTIDVRDVAVLERAYAAVLAAKPTSIGRVDFRLEPDNAAKAYLYGEAVRDAARRARSAVEAAGARLGSAKVIDPAGQVCRTQVLAGWPSYSGRPLATDVPPPPGMAFALSAPPAPAAEVMVTGSRVAAPEPVQVTLQPPLQTLEADACVIYGLL